MNFVANSPPTSLVASSVLDSLSKYLPSSLRVVDEIYQRNDQVGIYLCEDSLSKQMTVLKYVNPHSSSTHQVNVPQTPLVLSMSSDSLAQELAVAQRLYYLGGHRNIVTYVKPCVSHHTYVMMEYCCHGDLFTLVSQQPTRCFDERLALQFFSKILNGVQFLHNTLGIAHRDLSLENILLDAQWCPKLCDFGLSTNASRPSNDIVGKLFYMAPEVVAGKAYNPIQADIWSLGILLFIMLTGSPLISTAEKSNPIFHTFEKVGVKGVLHQWGLDTQLSKTVIVLLDSMLQIDPLKRLTSVDPICHKLSLLSL